MTVLRGDCLDVMPTLDAESIDAIVTDPPYGLTFMGRDWDHGVPGEHFWREAIRVAKPGAHLLAFGGTRTYHRLACAIEDAGWEVRDCLVWAYASGFPKSHNLDGDWQGWGTALKPAWEPIILARKPLRGTVAANVVAHGTGALNIDGCRIGPPMTEAEIARSGKSTNGALYGGLQPVDWKRDGGNGAGRWPANLVLTDPIFDGDTPGVVGGGSPTPARSQNRLSANPGTDGERAYGRGMGASSPGYLQTYDDSGTYSRFFQLQEGDGCYLCGCARTADESSGPSSPSDASAPDPAPTAASSVATTTTDSPTTSGTATPFWPDADASTPPTPRSKPRGTSPASERQSDPAKSAESRATGTTTTTRDRWTCATCAALTTSPTTFEPGEARLFLIPKASRADREPVVGGLEEVANADWPQEMDPGAARGARPRANHHPTVKPVALMRHLVRLITPPGGIVLDPFLGSGTTAIAAEMEGFRCIGIEREEEYVRIAEARLALVQQGLGL